MHTIPKNYLLSLRVHLRVTSNSSNGLPNKQNCLLNQLECVFFYQAFMNQCEVLLSNILKIISLQKVVGDLIETIFTLDQFCKSTPNMHL